MRKLKVNPQTVERVIADALAEDLGAGDITSRAVIPAAARFAGVLSAHEPLVVAGLDLACLIFARLAPGLVWEALAAEGDFCPAGAVLARLRGPARELLTAERTALNLLQHLSGIATITRSYVQRICEAVGPEGPTLIDTRKTIPGLRELAKYATVLGGAQNHRLRLDDGVLIKDNHLAVAGSVAEAVARARVAGLTDIEVECDNLEQVAEALAAGVTRLLLDNMDNDTLRRAVKMARGRAKTEASGGVNLDTIGGIALTCVDYISVGRITQSAPAVDISLDWTPLAGGREA
jgi:nicotinate-nucleotide pyrophosphorylase (carboxylating)